MEGNVKRETSIRIADSPDNSGKVVEYNVNMSVLLSNSKRSKIFQRTQGLLIILMSLAFLMVLLQLRREVRGLEEQMNSMNSNLMVLMMRCERLNRINRMNDRRTRSAESIEAFIDSRNKDRYAHETSHERERKGNCSGGHEGRSEDSEPKESSDSNARVERSTARRFSRSVVTLESNNVTDVTIDNQWSDGREGRAKREEVRGKQRRKMNRRPKRSRRRLGPLVATFVGAVPEQHVTDTVYIGPWVKRNETRYGFNKFHLVEDKRSIEVTANGLYMISAQIYYYGEKTHYSYWILLSSEGSSTTRKIVKCATVAAVSATEASCYTSVILPLRRGDRVHIQQQERNRLINLREGHSYIQVVLLSSDQQKKRLAT